MIQPVAAPASYPQAPRALASYTPAFLIPYATLFYKLFTIDGFLNETLSTLAHLKVLVLRNNSKLSGAIPEVVRDWALQGSLSRLDLRDTAFSYPPPVGLQQICDRTNSGLDCSGLPPYTCSAFGASHEVSSSDNTRCTRCTTTLVAGLSVAGMLLAFFLVMGGYAYINIKYPERTTQITSTIGILISHLQTLTLIR